MSLGKILLLAIPIAIAALMTEREKNAKPKPAPPPPPGGAPPPPPPPDTEPAANAAIIDALPEQAGKTREQMILSAVKAEQYDPIGWTFVTSIGKPGTPLQGYTLQVPVMKDALKIAGVRVVMTYPTLQYIADQLGLLMMTPYIDALTYEQADVRPTYTAPQPNTATKTGMLHTSGLVDDKIAAEAKRLGITEKEPFAGNVGKNWVLTRKFWLPGVHPETKVPQSQAAANHGLYRKPWDPVQNVGVAHNLDHVDQTQNGRLMGAQSILTTPEHEQQYRPTAELLTDADLAPLLTGELGVLRGRQAGEGALPAARHPAIPPLGVVV